MNMARAKKEGNYHFLNVQIPDEVMGMLSKYSSISRIPKNAITEIALREYLNKVLSNEE